MDKKSKNLSGSLCPAMASADLLGDKWTLLLLREMFLGTTRFSRFQKAIPRMSPSILSKRLKTLEAAEIIIRKAAPSGQATEYKLTRSGRELGPIVENMAVWGMRWRKRSIAAQDCDVGGFMWDFHRTLNTSGLPDGETVILVQISDRTDLNTWWVIVNDDDVDLCTDDPGHDVDVYLTAPLANLIALWLGDVGVQPAVDDQTIYLDGPRHLMNTAQDWMAQSPLVGVRPAASAR
ncbi:helix-turn-helix transcriptional regulator [Sulfitobacter mediterraneus]|jgi:DNA-binding HxlR family transcriptional regulator|uniref:winged helix-turn-helix transcriptional regulator n=2 Tax=Sulfitobacter mediterraneus TaxID=83219 RepID=UPI001931B830|nr:helix-turn-helix domain-containing protein [Sulfitobacter mediterraneus]MBM1631692.1 helix-turn-helix transcriptional regulator [Sulfitobacter mediterraneus]MBM1639507.1 helix-turn-helix transcriptional regulator [Sulfitobacter mediterraneus]MBM1647602.1 helix-turn-helix transcriptional regulator [Sulfitobacter mediterraneus]MBM1651647.1 helix-turn-helix transcriptional regulator [Sulfitobacter mediterraneus]MBM1655695.1 helix-turn-helix transcriptional regulator [Sulfitobacter mediterraneu